MKINFKKLLFRNWQRKLISIFIAIVVWLILKESSKPGFLDQFYSLF